MGRYWVVDASPIILLSKADHVDLLSACTEELLVPVAVADEVREDGEDEPARQGENTREERGASVARNHCLVRRGSHAAPVN